MAISGGAAKFGSFLLVSCASRQKCGKGLQPLWWWGGASSRQGRGGWTGRVGAGEELPARRFRQRGARDERGITPPFQSILAVAKRDAQSARGGSRSESNALFGHRRMSSSWGNDGDDFTSKHFRVPAGAVDQLADRMGWKSRRSGDWTHIEMCPDALCQGSESQQRSKHSGDNRFTFGINTSGGSFHCFRCDAKGSWFALKKALAGDLVSISSAGAEFEGKERRPRGGGSGAGRGEWQREEDEGELGERIAGYAENLEGDEGMSSVVRWLGEERCISADTMRKYGVGHVVQTFKGTPKQCASFPWYDDSGSKLPVRAKIRAVDDKKAMRLDPPGGGWGFFGWNTIEDGDESVVVTEGEIDALTVHQETGRKVISLPNGARSLPPQLVKMLERFTTIYLWLDDDVAGQDGAASFARKLGVQRCLIVRTRGGGGEGPKDANDALKALWEARLAADEKLSNAEEEGGADFESASTALADAESAYDFERMIGEAEQVKHDSIIKFSDMRSRVRQHLSNHIEAAGVPYGKALGGLNKILKGHRPGELTLVTGRTGQGKTTMVSQLSLELSEQGVHTLWGSFEIKNDVLAVKMLQQHTKKNLKGCSDAVFDEAADSFQRLPMWYMTFYGSTQIEQILDAMEYAVYAYDVRHIVLDNLQFMTASTSGKRGDSNIFQVLDETITSLRMFASEKGVHVTLVVHPRKEEDGKLLQISSIFGSAKATQESDNVVILQDNGVFRFLDVRKNRFDGTMGSVPFEFSKETMSYREMTPQEIVILRQKLMSQHHG